MLKIDAFRREDVQMVGVTEEDVRARVKWMQGICCEKLSCSVFLQVELTCYNVPNLPLQIMMLCDSDKL